MSAPEIRTFATLSPLPGFWNRYLKRILEQGVSNFQMKREDILESFSQRVKSILTKEYEKKTGSEEQDFGNILLKILGDSKWIEDENYLRYLEKPLSELAYFYITREKDKKGRPLNPVANFHMSNGATITKKNINFLGNRAQKGLNESCGIMVNYVYSKSWFEKVKSSFQSLLRI
jgi:hypothetical protein